MTPSRSGSSDASEQGHARPTSGRGAPVGAGADARIYRSWDHAELILDIAPGDPEGFSLAAGPGEHFVLKASACPLPET